MPNENKPDETSRAEWNIPAPEHIPQPTYWPFILAFGITCLLIGIVTSYLFSIVGAVVMFIAIAKWVGELVHADGRGKA